MCWGDYTQGDECTQGDDCTHGYDVHGDDYTQGDDVQGVIIHRELMCTTMVIQKGMVYRGMILHS